MEKKSCCCAGEAETVNVNMETTEVTGAEATANTVTAGICRPVCLKRLLQSSLIQSHQNLRGGGYQERKRGDRCGGTLRDDQEDDVEMGGNNEI